MFTRCMVLSLLSSGLLMAVDDVSSTTSTGGGVVSPDLSQLTPEQKRALEAFRQSKAYKESEKASASAARILHDTQQVRASTTDDKEVQSALARVQAAKQENEALRNKQEGRAKGLDVPAESSSAGIIKQ